MLKQRTSVMPGARWRARAEQGGIAVELAPGGAPFPDGGARLEDERARVFVERVQLDEGQAARGDPTEGELELAKRSGRRIAEWLLRGIRSMRRSGSPGTSCSGAPSVRASPKLGD